MLFFDEIADWVDRQSVGHRKQLDNLQRKYPVLLVLTSAAKLSWWVSEAFADTLRLGDGIKKGGWGYAQDGLRLLSLAGPITKMLHASTKVTQILQVQYAHQNGPICAWVSVTKTLRLTNPKHLYLTEEQLMATAGRKLYGAVGDSCLLPPIAKQPFRDLVPVLQAMGAKVKHLGKPRSIRDLERWTQMNPNGVINFGVRLKMTARTSHGYELFTAYGAHETATVMKMGKGYYRFGGMRGADEAWHLVKKGDYILLQPKFQNFGHRMAAYRTPRGQFRIVDRETGNAHSLLDLDALGYEGMWMPDAFTDAFFIEDAAVVFLQNAPKIARVAYAVRIAVAMSRDEESYARKNYPELLDDAD